MSTPEVVPTLKLPAPMPIPEIEVEPWRLALWHEIGFDPHPGQCRLFDTYMKHQYTECEAGRGGGKSYAAARMIVFPEWVRWKETVSDPWEWPRYVLLVAPQLDQSTIIFDDVYNIAYDRGIPLRRDRRSGSLDLITAWGSRLRCMSGKNPTAMRGFAWNIVVIDEGSFLDHAAYVVDSILKGTVGRRKGKIIIIGSPDAPGSFTHTCALRGDNPGIPEWGHCKFTSLDNWHTPWMRDFILSEIRQGVPIDVIRREYLAEFVPREGLVYPEAANCVMDEKEILAVQEDLFKYGTWFRFIDFGFKNPFACIVHCRLGETLYAWEEYYKTQQTIDVHAGVLARMDSRYDFRLNIGDLEARSDLEYLAAYTYRHPERGHIKLKGGWVMKGSKPHVVERVDCLRRLMATGRYRINSRCVNYIGELGRERYADPGSIRNYSEQPVDSDNHGSSGSGYGAWYLFGKATGKHRPIVTGGQRDDILQGYHGNN